jgi:ADP-heptose:LPS heptosyltransferase/2-polyprenyl-3-methyl-5-hydroxy-6-metoxy-1,4-benzoquinol methylase
MPTSNRRQFVPQAIKYFLRQDYPHKELIILDDGTDKIRDLVPEVPEIQYTALSKKLTVGEKRNLAIEHSRGEIIIHWDDDDWMHPCRISYQVSQLVQANADINGMSSVLFYDLCAGKLWLYEYPANRRAWLCGGTLCYRKAFWAQKKFAPLNIGEDAKFVWAQPVGKMFSLPDFKFYVALIHPHNTCAKPLSGSWWRVWEGESVQTLMNGDWDFYALAQGNPAQTTPTPSLDRPTALVSAASGIGDILRITPLIRVFARLGYHVDVLLAPDDLTVVTLLEGAAEIRRLFYLPSVHSHERHQHLDGLDRQVYDVATYTVWSLPLRRLVRARRTLAFEQSQWLREGDSACVAKIARGVGWDDPLPAPFAIPSQRRFDLAPNTIALHPGCKPNWPWKKWHGFEELARLIPAVVIIGTAADAHNEQTYFARSFEWPARARNFAGTLSLPDTAALLRQCAALVANDSGVMHLGVAMGIPTFGIFGLTSPQREAIPAANMFPITKGLPCEPACRQLPWGRRDCEYHLQCLKSLTAEEVLSKVREVVPDDHRQTVSQPPEWKTMSDISVVYYGNVFDASGYGQAARAYIQALHRAGITLSVVDLAGHARQVRDELVESLVGREINADFHLFHGIPPQWARLAFRLPNAIGMTVWETDTMPTQWRNILSHVLEVWLPCEFNVHAFRRALETSIFKLPHALLPLHPNGNVLEPSQWLGVTERDFVFYSLFEWQERKSPHGLLEAFFRAFPTETDAVLIIKANPGAASVAAQAVERARQQTRSTARVIVRCEAWNEAQIGALHRRGDCYVSLHRGEGWCYPLFAAASQGTPVVATNYSGPLEYLNPQDHQLVQYELTSVQQPYFYYHPRMRWAAPKLSHAAELMRWVYDHREAARAQAARAAQRIQRTYSPDAIGTIARERLLHLLKRTQPQKWKHLERSRRATQLSPAIPIPGEWFDEDYFERGVKSNWDRGYTWPVFAGLFRDTVAFLTSIFPEASSYLDIGCAKGFLVRTLREAGKECWGFDHSPWAIAHAEEGVKPFVTLTSTDDVTFDRQFDLLLAFEVFAHLSETQVLSFLSRARAWTRIGIVATIPSFANEEEEQVYQRSKDDGDLAHITMRTRQWWHKTFLQAGWRQDPLHKVVERLCQAHALPTKMGWKVYVYAPG